MKAVILSCNTGGGHNAAAKALKEAFEARGHRAEVVDFLALAGRAVSKTVGGGYVEMVKLSPRAFGAVYDLGMAVSRHTSRSPVYFANAGMAGVLKRYFVQNQVDAVLLPHLFPAETITWMKRHGVELPLTISVGTDYTCIPFWEETDCDCSVLPHPDLVEEYCARGIARENLWPLGIPVSPAFVAPLERSAARANLGLELSGPLYLVVGGSMGAGNLGRLTSSILSLSEQQAAIVVICGSNDVLRKNLQAKFKKAPRVTILGITTQMREWLAACDVVYTKPGGLTSTEAAAARALLVHTDPIPGCETENRRFFMEHGLSVSGKTPHAQAAAGIALLHDPAAVCRMRRAQAAQITADAAEKICMLAEEKLAQRETIGEKPGVNE